MIAQYAITGSRAGVVIGTGRAVEYPMGFSTGSELEPPVSFRSPG
jgi:NH3-dependent NAD+ synthetase